MVGNEWDRGAAYLVPGSFCVSPACHMKRRSPAMKNDLEVAMCTHSSPSLSSSPVWQQGRWWGWRCRWRGRRRNTASPSPVPSSFANFCRIHLNAEDALVSRWMLYSHIRPSFNISLYVITLFHPKFLDQIQKRVCFRGVRHLVFQNPYQNLTLMWNPVSMFKFD